MRSKRLRKYRKRFRHILLFGKVLLVWYLIVFSISFVTTSDTTADFTDLKEVRGMIYVAGDWKDVDESAFEFIKNKSQEWNTCDSKTIKTSLKNVGTENMRDKSKYAVYFHKNGNPKTHGVKMDLPADEGIIPKLKKDESIELIFKATKPGTYIFVAYQLDAERTEIWSEEIILNCEPEPKQDSEEKPDKPDGSKDNKKESSEDNTEQGNENENKDIAPNDDKDEEDGKTTKDDSDDKSDDDINSEEESGVHEEDSASTETNDDKNDSSSQSDNNISDDDSADTSDTDKGKQEGENDEEK